MELSPRVKELAKKLLALVKGGATAGEKESAEAALKRHLDRYNLTIEEVDGTDLIDLEIPIVHPDQLEETKFSVQIVANVIGVERTDAMESLRDTQTGEQFYLVRVTVAEGVEIKAKIEFYWADFLLESKVFRMAYIAKNQLGIDGPPGEEQKKAMSPELTRKIHRMMDGVDQKTFHKRLN